VTFLSSWRNSTPQLSDKIQQLCSELSPDSDSHNFFASISQAMGNPGIARPYAALMDKRPSAGAIAIRPAVSQDAAGITQTYLESAEYHAGLDSARYGIPQAEEILERYRQGQQHPSDAHGEAITLVAELGSEIVGFVDARLTRSPDPMHREMLYCFIVEIAVSNRHQAQGIGRLLLQAAEDWGRSQGADLASLEYLVANQRASRLYERLGYRPASIIATKGLR
jgi:ribosomal protein S18 acetylase RimI-like enzyme